MQAFWLQDKIDASWIVQNHVMRRKNRPEIFPKAPFSGAPRQSEDNGISANQHGSSQSCIEKLVRMKYDTINHIHS